MLGFVLEWGLRAAHRWTGSKGWSRTSVIFQAFYWQPIFWCVLVAASEILASFSEFSVTRQVGQGVIWALLLISITIVFVRIRITSYNVCYTKLLRFLGPDYRVHPIALKRGFLHLDVVLSLPRPGLAIICREAFVESYNFV